MSKTLFNIKDIVTPKSGLVVYTKSYWLCVDGDPTKALFFGESPQCNKNRVVCEKSLNNTIYTDYSKSLQVVYVETAFVPQRD